MHIWGLMTSCGLPSKVFSRMGILILLGIYNRCLQKWAITISDELGSKRGGSHDGMDERASQGSRLPCNAGSGAHWDKKGGTLRPDGIGCEVVARGVRRVL